MNHSYYLVDSEEPHLNFQVEERHMSSLEVVPHRNFEAEERRMSSLEVGRHRNFEVEPHKSYLPEDSQVSYHRRWYLTQKMIGFQVV